MGLDSQKIWSPSYVNNIKSQIKKFSIYSLTTKLLTSNFIFLSVDILLSCLKTNSFLLFSSSLKSHVVTDKLKYILFQDFKLINKE